MKEVMETEEEKTAAEEIPMSKVTDTTMEAKQTETLPEPMELEATVETVVVETEVALKMEAQHTEKQKSLWRGIRHQRQWWRQNQPEQWVSWYLL